MEPTKLLPRNLNTLAPVYPLLDQTLGILSYAAFIIYITIFFIKIITNDKSSLAGTTFFKRTGLPDSFDESTVNHKLGSEMTSKLLQYFLRERGVHAFPEYLKTGGSSQDHHAPPTSTTPTSTEQLVSSVNNGLHNGNRIKELLHKLFNTFPTSVPKTQSKESLPQELSTTPLPLISHVHSNYKLT